MRVLVVSILPLIFGACDSGRTKGPDQVEASAAASVTGASAAAAAREPPAPARLPNPIAYIPSQCFTKTRTASGVAKNPCYACHGRSEPPNFANDGDLQTTLSLPPAAAKNPWTNLIEPPSIGAPSGDASPDDDVLRYVRQSNYFDDGRRLVLSETLSGTLPQGWDLDGDQVWGGFKPDVRFAFDDRGFDRLPDGSPTGWRAFAYYPFLGTFFPTNGSTDDVLVRLDPALQRTADGRFDQTTYEVNLAIVEALITRSDVAIDPVDEAALGVDLDGDGRLGRAARVAFDAGDGKGSTRMHYVGRAGDDERAGRFPIAPGLFPLGTEFFHTVRYLDVGPDGIVTMAPRMKEVRYAKKVKFLDYKALERQVAADAREQAESPNGARRVYWRRERGIDNGQGWLFQGFIEDAGGKLRPQSREESSFCGGCHGGIGATSDAIFSFARKLGPDQPARGWFHWSQHSIRGLPEPRRRDGQYEYTYYLQQAGAGDELRENAEVVHRFFDERGDLRPAEIEGLHHDIAQLLLPSADRALALDRAYRAIVRAQSFIFGRDAVLAPATNVYADVPLGQKTGIARSIDIGPLARAARRP